MGKADTSRRAVIFLRVCDGLAWPAAGRSQVLHAARSSSAQMVSAPQDARARDRAAVVFQRRRWREVFRHERQDGGAVGSRSGDTELAAQHNATAAGGAG